MWDAVTSAYLEADPVTLAVLYGFAVMVLAILFDGASRYARWKLSEDEPRAYRSEEGIW